MKAVIMAGGKGTRLRPLTCNTPKPMVPLLDRPVMEYAIDLLKRHGITEIATTVQYLPEVIRQYFGDGSEFGIHMHYAEEEQPLGTAGSVKQAKSFLNETFVVLSGDALTDFDLTEAIVFHRKQRAAVTIILTRVDNPLEYGVVMTDKTGAVSRFLEKPNWGEVFSDTVNTGIYIVEPFVLDYIESGREFDFSKELFPLLMQKGERLSGYVASGYWSDIGNLEHYRKTQFDMLDGKVNVQIRGKELFPSVWVGERVKLAGTIEIEGPAYVGDDCRIEEKVRIGRYSVLGTGTCVKRQVHLEQAVLWGHSSVESDADIKGATIGRNAVIGTMSSLRDGSVLGDGCQIGRHVVVQPAVRLWPGKYAEPYAHVHESVILGEKKARPLFGDNGIKGTPYADISTLFATKLALAYATTHPVGSQVTIAHDTNPFSSILAVAFSAGLHTSGLNTVQLGAVVPPVSRHATHTADCRGGVHFRCTASAHGEQMVIEFWDASGLPIDQATERKIENAYAQEDSRKISPGDVGYAQIDELATWRYREQLLQSVETPLIRSKSFSIVIAFEYSPFKGLMPELFDALGCSMIHLYVKANTRELGEMVRLSGADIGVRFDEAGQLLALTDESGTEVSEHIISVLKMLVRLDASSGDVYVPVNVPDIVVDLANRIGIRIVRTKADFRSRMAALQKDGFHPTYDGMYTLAHLLRMMASEDKTLSELLADIPQFALYQQIVDCPWQEKGAVMRFLMDHTQNHRVELIDGIKIYHDDGWTLIRPDGDEPYVRILVQAPSTDNAERWAVEYATAIQTYRSRTIIANRITT